MTRNLNELLRGNVSRRTFMQGAAGALMAGSFPGAARAETPRKGGDLILGLDGAGISDSLDPVTYTATHIQVIGYQWGNGLVELDETTQPKPELAESWEANADSTRWVFKIRKGVTFHNGKSLTAADVVYSLNHHRDPASKSSARIYLAPVEDIQATGPLEVTFILSTAE